MSLFKQATHHLQLIKPKELFDINGHLIRNEIATYIFRVNGNAMIDAGIFDGDVLVVDRSIEPKHNDIVLAQT